MGFVEVGFQTGNLNRSAGAVVFYGVPGQIQKDLTQVKRTADEIKMRNLQLPGEQGQAVLGCLRADNGGDLSGNLF